MRGRFILTSLSLWSDLTIIKTEKRAENYPQWQYHPRPDVIIRKPNSPCRHAKKVVEAVIVATIFIGVAMKGPNPLCLLAIARKEKQKTNPQYQP